MSDITQAAEQQALADSLENAPIVGEVVEEQQQQPSTEETTEQLETAEVEQPVTEEEADDYLPTEQEKVFPQDALDRYGKRYGYTPEEIAADPRIQRFLHDKINSDIFIRSQREAEQMQELEIQGQAKQQAEPTREPQTFEQVMQQKREWATKNTDPLVSKWIADNFLEAFDVRDEKGNAAKASPEMAAKLTGTLSTGAYNFMQTALPQLLPEVLDAVLPGFSAMYQTASQASAWDAVRNSDPKYESLPAYGTREFRTLAEGVERDYPALAQLAMAVRSQNGGKLVGQGAQQVYAAIANVVAKQTVSPAEVKQAVQTGKNQANKTAIRKDAANLGAGQSKGQIAQKPDHDDIFGDGLKIYQREHGNL